MLNSIWKGIEPAVVNLIVISITTFVGVLTTEATKLLKKSRESVVTKIGSENYNFARTIAMGLYQLYEDKFKDVANAGALKKEAMEKALLKMFPSLTQTELDAINKDVWANYNHILDNSGITSPASIEVNVNPVEVDTADNLLE